MTLDNIKGRKTTEPGVREFCIQNKLCFYCKEPGHGSQSCPNKRTKIRELATHGQEIEEDTQSQVGGTSLMGKEQPLR